MFMVAARAQIWNKKTHVVVIAGACVRGRSNAQCYGICSLSAIRMCVRTNSPTHTRTDGRTLLNMHAVCSVRTPMRQCGRLALRTLLYSINSTQANTQYDISARVVPTSEARPPVVASKPGCCNATVLCVCVRFLNYCRRSLLEGGTHLTYLCLRTHSHTHIV